jgi:hypothetical protein
MWANQEGFLAVLGAVAGQHVILHEVAKKLLDLAPNFSSLNLWISGNAFADLPILHVNQMSKDAARAGLA